MKKIKRIGELALRVRGVVIVQTLKPDPDNAGVGKML